MRRSSMQSRIPTEMREQLAADKFMQRCILEDETCSGRIEWHHAMSYAGRRVNELYSIIPLCSNHHRQEGKFRHQIKSAVMRRIQHFDLLDEYRAKYPKATLIAHL